MKEELICTKYNKSLITDSTSTSHTLIESTYSKDVQDNN